MPTYLIEIPHSGDLTECQQVIRLFVESGSHLLSNASWGCKDGVHKAWFINDFESRDEALKIIPPFLRHHAQIIELTRFSKTDLIKFSHG
jgi:hypothetical protein